MRKLFFDSNSNSNLTEYTLLDSSHQPPINHSSSYTKWLNILGAQLMKELNVTEHWLQYDPPSNLAHYFLGMLYLIIFIAALFGNASIFWLFYK
jgi:hypothetical protein